MKKYLESTLATPLSSLPAGLAGRGGRIALDATDLDEKNDLVKYQQN